MTAAINERRNDIVSEAIRLFKDIAEQTMIKMATTKVVGAQDSSRKTVTFAANLTKKFDEAK